MLVDDNPYDNFFHERVIRKCDFAQNIVVKLTAMDALAYLRTTPKGENTHPDLIFLDINMPAMDGWEFLEEYSKLEEELQSKIVIVMLSTSQNPEDIEKARKSKVPVDFRTKPLTREMLEEMWQKYVQSN